MPTFYVYCNDSVKGYRVEVIAPNERSAKKEAKFKLKKKHPNIYEINITKIKEKEIIIPDTNEGQQCFTSLKDIFGIK